MIISINSIEKGARGSTAGFVLLQSLSDRIRLACRTATLADRKKPDPRNGFEEYKEYKSARLVARLAWARCSKSGLALTTSSMGDILARMAEAGVLSGTGSHWLNSQWQRLAAFNPCPHSPLTGSAHLDSILDPGGVCLREAERQQAFLSLQRAAEDEAAQRHMAVTTGDLHPLHHGDSRHRKEEQLLQLPADSRQQKPWSSSQGNSAPVHPLEYAISQLGWEGWLYYRTLLMEQQQQFSVQVLLTARQLVHAMAKCLVFSKLQIYGCSRWSGG